MPAVLTRKNAPFNHYKKNNIEYFYVFLNFTVFTFRSLVRAYTFVLEFVAR